MKGDRVTIIVETGAGTTREFVVEATKNGRKVEIVAGSKFVDVSELTHTDRTIRTSKFALSKVVALVDEPEPEEGPELLPIRIFGNAQGEQVGFDSLADSPAGSPIS